MSVAMLSAVALQPRKAHAIAGIAMTATGNVPGDVAMMVLGGAVAGLGLGFGIPLWVNMAKCEKLSVELAKQRWDEYKDLVSPEAYSGFTKIIAKAFEKAETPAH